MIKDTAQIQLIYAVSIFTQNVTVQTPSFPHG